MENYPADEWNHAPSLRRRIIVLNEMWQMNPMVIELVRRVDDTHVFLRMAAIELRRMATQAPDVAVELCHVAKKLEAEADDLVRDTGSGPNPTIGSDA